MVKHDLQIDALVVRKGAFTLGPLSLTIKSGEYLVVTGANGSGKTTLLEVLAGLVPVRDGQLLAGGEPITHRPPERRGMGVVFQDGALFPHLTVAENVVFGLRIRQWEAGAIARRLAEIADAVEISGLLHRAPTTLSGGEQRRVAIARALASSPSVLLLDEPLAGVDPSRTQALLTLLSKLHRTLGLTVVHVAHLPQEIQAVAERVVVIHHGHIKEVEKVNKVNKEGEELPIKKNRTVIPGVDARQARIHARQLTLPGWSPELQARLHRATVLITRVGGLGGPIAQQLVLAGVGKLILAHGGVLEEEDMNRMVLMDAAQVGQPRLPQAVAALKRLNPSVTIQAIPVNLETLDHAKALIKEADVVVSATPAFEERFLLNRASMETGVPLVEAAMDGWMGTLTTILPGQTACLACRTPEAPPDWDPVGFPVMSATSAAMGGLAAHEAIRLAAGAPPVLAGRLMVMDAESMDVRHFVLRRDPACFHCGARKVPTRVSEEEATKKFS